ncbi:MAG: beta-glucanase, partial [Paramuribaculum sp.]|nr:beta-glucanase [Paramuribaculum sp.]
MRSIFLTVSIALATLFSTADATSPKWVLEWEDNFEGTEPNPEIWSRIDRGTSDWCNYMTKADTCYDMRDGKLVLRGIAAYEGCNDTVPY